MTAEIATTVPRRRLAASMSEILMESRCRVAVYALLHERTLLMSQSRRRSPSRAPGNDSSRRNHSIGDWHAAKIGA